MPAPFRLAAVPIALLVLGFRGPSSPPPRPEADQAEWIDLFNGRDLEGWVPKISGYALGENFANTFRVENGLLEVRYDGYDQFNERFGHLFFETPFSHYRLEVEYRFVGEQVAGGPDWARRNSGVMLHSQDPATMTRDQDFPISIEVQFLGGLGQGPRSTGNVCTPGTEIVINGKQASDHCIESTSPTFDGDQWVRSETIVLGDSVIVHMINGDTVLTYTKPTIGGGVVSGYDPAVKIDGTRLTSGFIALQSESHPIDFRRVRLLDLTAQGAPSSFEYPFQNPTLPEEERVTDLIGRMTLEEKIDALGFTAAVPRFGVKGSRHIEGYHGVAQGGPSNWGRRNPTATTQFPQAYGLGSTWDPDLIRRVAAQEAQEARYLYQSAKYDRSGIIIRAPNADLARDPRWGRTEEVYGEDPFHVGTLATAFVRGLQGDHPRYWKTAALLKHFLANSNEDDRSRSSSDFDERLWREYYAKPFEMAVRQGGSRALMAAYNAVNGTPAHVHPMLKEIVVGEWGLDGIICTDGGGLRLLVSAHQAFPDLPTAAAACIRSGINNFLDRYQEPVAQALERGLLTEADLDEALRGLFRVSIRLGLLDPAELVPYAAIGAPDDPEPWHRPVTRALVREVTQKSIVLLQNSAGLLPLNRETVRSVAVIGPLSNEVLLDWYSGTPPYRISPREGIESVARGVGVSWVGDMSEAAIEMARERDVAVVCVGNHPEGNAGWEVVTSPSEGKEAVDRKAITLPPGQEEFVRRVIEVNPNTVVVLITSFPVALPWVAEHATTILHMTHASQELGNALGDVLFGDVDPGGRLAQTWPRSLDQLPPMMDYDIRNGRTYMYFEGEPQYHFGHGLSYTTFALANLRTSSATMARDGAVDVSVDVTNTGPRAGDEVVQLYVRYPEATVSRPRKQLRGFQRVSLAAGETASVTMRLAATDLGYWEPQRKAWVVEAGPVEVLVGRSASDAELTSRTRVTVGR